MISKNYISKIFNKSKDDLTISDIENFFDTPQEETSILEFKSGQVEIIDIYKEITAFLNTEGGLIIIGSPREKNKKIKKNEITICEGELTYSHFKNKDWIYQKIASNIVPTPVGLKIEEFITEKGAIYLIDVPQSSIPPHQSSADGKYYIRLEREAKPAPHGIIQALFDKRRKPKLTGKIKIKPLNEFNDQVTVRIANESPVPADKVSYIIEVYNVRNIESEYNFSTFNDTLGKKITLSSYSNEILVQIISIPIDFQIRHKGEEYLIMVGYWCSAQDFDFNFMTYSPNQKSITKQGTFKEGENIVEELERIHRN